MIFIPLLDRVGVGRIEKCPGLRGFFLGGGRRARPFVGPLGLHSSYLPSFQVHSSILRLNFVFIRLNSYLFHVHPSWFIAVSYLFNGIRLQFAFIRLHSSSFILIHLHSSSFILVRIHSYSVLHLVNYLIYGLIFASFA